MATRPRSTSTADLPSIDSAALDEAMKAHPVVIDAIERMAADRRAVAAERDQAMTDRDKAKADLGAEQKAHRTTKAALEASQDIAEKMVKSLGAEAVARITKGAGAATASAAAPTISDAEALAKWEKMGPEERAAVMMKAAPVRRFDFRGDDAMPGGRFFG